MSSEVFTRFREEVDRLASMTLELTSLPEIELSLPTGKATAACHCKP